MDAHLIPNEKGQLAEEALEAPQPQQQVPPSYHPPTYPVQQHQGIVIQNIPVQQNSGCCGGSSHWFKHSAGVSTGVIQLILAIIACILSGVTIRMHIVYANDYYNTTYGSPIAATIFFFLPAGILGACSKTKNNCVIVGYLVMSILSAIEAAFVCALEAVAACTSSYVDDYGCSPDYFPYPIDGYEEGFERYPECGEVRYKALTAIHAVISVLMFIEFIVAIVACAICCGGLSCCCARPNPQTNINNMMYYPTPGMPAVKPAQNEAHVVRI